MDGSHVDQEREDAPHGSSYRDEPDEMPHAGASCKETENEKSTLVVKDDSSSAVPLPSGSARSWIGASEPVRNEQYKRVAPCRSL